MTKNKYYFKIILLMSLAALGYYSLNLNSWKFSFVGDEWPFYVFARYIVTNHFLFNPFDFHGVYGQNSVLSSMYQALFLQLFGFSAVAWKLSNIFLIIPISIFFYQWMKKQFTGRIAFLSTIILQCSFYFANFFKVGKNMPQALALFLACLFVAGNCVDKPNRKNLSILGILLGLSFYVYIGPIFPLIIWPEFLPLLRAKNKRIIIINSVFLLAPYLLLLLAALIQPASLAGPAGKTLLHREFSDNWQIVINMFHNFLLFYKNYDYLYNQFVAEPYLDIISEVLAFAGTIIVLIKIRKWRYLKLSLVYILTCVVIGFTSPYTYAPITRGIFFIPFGAAFAGIGLSLLQDVFARRNKTIANTLAVITLLSIFLLNLYQSQIGAFKISGYTATGLVIREMQEAKKNDSHIQIQLLLSDANQYNSDNLIIMRQAYNLETVPFSVSRSRLVSCPSLKGQKILIFQSDVYARTALESLRCPPHSIKILQPTMQL